MNEILAAFLTPEFITNALFTFGILVLGIWVNRRLAKNSQQYADLEKQISDPASHKALLASLNKPLVQAYEDRIQKLLNWADDFFGELHQYKHGLFRCLQIATVYPTAILLGMWVLFDNGILAETHFFPHGIELWKRLLVVASIAFLFWTARTNFHDLSAFNRKHFSFFLLSLFFAMISSALSGTPSIAAALHGVAFCVALSTSTKKYLAGFVAGYLICAFILFGPTFSDAVFGSKFSIDATMTPVGAVAFSSMFTYFFFCFVLPVSNAAIDYVSLTASRYLLLKLQRRATASPRGWLWIVPEILLDFAIALGCLAILLYVLAIQLDVWKAMYPGEFSVEWRSFRHAFDNSEFAKLSMPILLGASTIIPTIAHISVGLGAIFTHRHRCLRHAANILNTPQISTAEQHEARDLILEARTRGYLWALMITLALTALVGGAIWAFFLWLI